MVNVMLFLMSVMSPPPILCGQSVLTIVYWGVFVVFWWMLRTLFPELGLCRIECGV